MDSARRVGEDSSQTDRPSLRTPSGRLLPAGSHGPLAVIGHDGDRYGMTSIIPTAS